MVGAAGVSEGPGHIRLRHRERSARRLHKRADAARVVVVAVGDDNLLDLDAGLNLIREFSEQSQNYIDEEIARIMDERYKYVVKLLKQHKDLLEYIANRLVEVETMDGKEFYEIVKGEQHCKELTESAGKKELSFSYHCII